MLDNHETLREEPRKRHSDEILGTNGQVFSERDPEIFRDPGWRPSAEWFC